MEEMEEEPPTPPTPASPFWLSSRTTCLHRPSSALLLNTGLHVAFLSIIAIVFMVLVTPSLLSHTQQFFRPSSVKRGWDSLNLVLVAFAIVCGFLGRKGGEEQPGNEDREGSKVETPQYVRSGQQSNNWYSYGDQGNVVQLSPLRRACSSYPDLIRQEMMWDDEYNRRPRCYDDSYSVNWCKSPRLVRSTESFRSQKMDPYEDSYDVKVIEVDSVRMHPPNESPPQPTAVPPSPSPEAVSGKEFESVGRRDRRDGQGRKKLDSKEDQSLPPPPPPPPSAAVSGKEFESVGRRVRRNGQGIKKLETREDQSPPPVRARSPPPPPSDSTASVGARIRVKREDQGRRKLDPREAQSVQPPPPPPPPALAPESSRSAQKKRSGMPKDIISSIYHQSKRKKKQNSKSQENLEDLINPNFPPPSPPPPPPPLPPPPSFFQNMFSSKKAGKSGKKSSSSRPHPPPPPPPPPRRRRPPPPSPKRTNFDLSDKIVGKGSEFPSIPIPPPPPPPPFKVPSWKFVIEGDYVKIVGSPLRDDDSGASTPTAASPLYCPSPDVNIKADDFIARFRAKLKLEKMNSIKNKRGMEFSLSPLGPDSSPSPV